MYSYTGMLTSSMASRPYEFLANSPEDVAKNDKILPYMPNNSPGQEYLRVWLFSQLNYSTVMKRGIQESPLETSKIIYERATKFNTFVPLNSDFPTLLSGENRVLIIVSTNTP